MKYQLTFRRRELEVTSMGAGGSAWTEARRAQLRAAEYERQARAERERTYSFEIASRTEARVAALLRPMSTWGWRLLPDRRWPGRGRANIDMIHVGPGGVLVIDVKCWAEPDIVDGRLYRGQADAQDDLDSVRHAADEITEITADLGLAPTEVIPVMVFVNQRPTQTELGRVKIFDESSLVPWAVARGPRLTDDQVNLLVELLDARFPSYEAPADVQVSTVIAEPVVPFGRHLQPQPDTLFDVESLQSALIASASTKPIEEWMTFLHPEQVRLVRRPSPGPTRIRGAAGTGKTVVALHRAAWMAESSGGPVLVTSFVKTLPAVLRGLYEQLSPATTDRVEFVNLHAWASALLQRRGQRSRVDIRFSDAAFSRAWARHGRSSCLNEVGVESSYWKDEVDYVIKGRGITDISEYHALRRVGRRTRMSATQREAVWATYHDYESQLRQAGMIDFNDLLAMALAEVTARPPERPYVAVIADEVQDLTCQAVRLLAAISDNGKRLLLVGDGQQQIYPGGFSLGEAGLSVTGRSTVLRTNYRNAVEIAEAAAQVVAGDSYDDLGESSEAGSRDVRTVHQGGSVWRETAASPADLRHRSVRQVQRLIADGHAVAGIALLTDTNNEVAAYQRLLTAIGIVSVTLSEYAGRPVDAVKVGTIQRAKGLEFKHVVHPVRSHDLRREASEGARQETRERERRELFVAMTRARDTLWLGQTA